MRRVVALGFAVVAALSAAPAWGSSALELVRIAHANEQAHEDEQALRHYMDALALDGTCADAYLGLASLRARRGDLHEAERVYSLALEHLPELRAARLGRAYVRRALGANAEAVSDLVYGLEDDVATLRVLAGWYAADGQTPAALAVWRHIAASADAERSLALRDEARTTIRALVILVGPADPVAHPPDEHPAGVRHAASVLARRGR